MVLNEACTSSATHGAANARQYIRPGGSSPRLTGDTAHGASLNGPKGLASSFGGAPYSRVPSFICRVWQLAQLERPSAIPFSVGTHRRSGSVPSGRARTRDFA